MMRFAWIAIAAGCAAARAQTAATRSPPASSRAPGATSSPGIQPVRGWSVRWANLITIENCFYFSGPFNGRDELLRGDARIESEGTAMRVQLGAALFEGTLTASSIDLKRITTRVHEGEWTVTETLTGTYEEGVLRAQYHYTECGRGEQCPGRCTMTADLVAKPR